MKITSGLFKTDNLDPELKKLFIQIGQNFEILKSICETQYHNFSLCRRTAFCLIYCIYWCKRWL